MRFARRSRRVSRLSAKAVCRRRSRRSKCFPASLHWHFIGRVQRNKVRQILPLFDVIHADRFPAAGAFTPMRSREELGLFPKVFLQVNVAGEDAKGGFEPDALRAGHGSICCRSIGWKSSA